MSETNLMLSLTAEEFLRLRTSSNDTNSITITERKLNKIYFLFIRAAEMFPNFKFFTVDYEFIIMRDVRAISYNGISSESAIDVKLILYLAYQLCNCKKGTLNNMYIYLNNTSDLITAFAGCDNQFKLNYIFIIPDLICVDNELQFTIYDMSTFWSIYLPILCLYLKYCDCDTVQCTVEFVDLKLLDDEYMNSFVKNLHLLEPNHNVDYIHFGVTDIGGIVENDENFDQEVMIRLNKIQNEYLHKKSFGAFLSVKKTNGSPYQKLPFEILEMILKFISYFK